MRGYQVRKQFKVLCWAVRILDKVVLRWKRKGAGLRSLRHETQMSEESEEDEDILKVFRKQKVDKAVEEAVSQVLSMVNSPDARQQYCRMLERYRQAKVRKLPKYILGSFYILMFQGNEDETLGSIHENDCRMHLLPLQAELDSMTGEAAPSNSSYSLDMDNEGYTYPFP